METRIETKRKRQNPVLIVSVLVFIAVLVAGLLITGRAGAAPASGSTAPFVGNGKILFMSTRDGNQDIYTMDNNGANQTRITTDPGSDNVGTWSPDGTKILFQSNRSGNSDIWVMNANGTGLVQITTDPGSDGHASWSPDGTQIAFVSLRDGDTEIFKMDANGANQIQLTNNTISDDAPDWSPDGAKIAFTRNIVTGNDEVFTINSDGSQPTNLTNTAGNDGSPDWSHDGSKIVFSSNRDGNIEIYSMNANGSSQTRLTNNAALDIAPAWSPDGTKIAFGSLRDSGNNEIYSMDANGSNQTRLTNNAATDQAADWQDSAPNTPTPTRTNTIGPTPTLTPCAGGTTFLNRSITASDTPLPNRFSQNGIAPSCAVPKPFPGSIATTNKHFDQYVLTNNTVTAQCVTITLIGSGCGTNKAVMTGVYSGTFNPASLSQNYLGDLGQSINAGVQQGVMSVSVPAFQTFVVVVYDIGTVAGCDNYTLRVDGCLTGPGPSPTRTATATRTATPTVTATPTIFPCPIVDTHVGALEATDPSFPARIVASNASTCAVPVAFPGFSAFSGPFFYDTYTYINTTGASQCVAVTLTAPACRTRVSAYLGSFNPADLTQNYLGTGGGDTQAGPVNMQVTVPAGQTVVFVVNEFNSSGATCGSYTIDVRTCGTLATPTSIPTATPTRTPSNTATDTPTNTPTATPTNTNTNTPLPTQTAGGATATPIPTNTNTPIPTNTPTRTSTNTPTRTCTNTPTRTPTRTHTNTPLPTQTPGGFTATPIPPTNTPSEPTSTPTSGQTTPTPTICTIEFSDVPQGSTFYIYIRCLACRGIINGYSDGTFRPSNNVTRGQLSKIVSNAAGFAEPHDTQTFEDIPTTDTFYIFIERMSSRGIIGGYPCGSPGEPCGSGNRPYFRPANNATRGQISKVVSNAAGYNDNPGDQIFEDVAPGSTFYDFVNRLANRLIMGGYACGGPGEPCVPPGNYPYFRPASNATRGQTSKIVSGTFFPECTARTKR